MRNRLIYVLLIAAALAAVAYSPLTSYLLKDFITYKLEKALDMDIVFGRVRFKPPAQLTVSDIKAMDKDGLALTSERAYLRLDPAKLLNAQFVLNCDFQNVNLKSGLGESFNKLLKPFGVPLQTSYRFDGIKGVITIKQGNLSITGLKGLGQDFRFSGNFTRFKDEKIDYELDFGINSRLVAANQGPAKTFFPGEAKDGWYSIKLSFKNGHPVFFSSGGIILQTNPVNK